MNPHSSITDRTDTLFDIAKEAGRITMRYFNKGVTVDYKADDSPVTQADIASSRYIEQVLAALTPTIPVVSEESDVKAVNAETFWLVDPLDGTRAFVEGVPEFAVSIGLIQDYQPVLGVLYVPPTGIGYMGGVGVPAVKIDANGARHTIQTRTPPAEHWTIIKSAKHASPKLQDFLQSYPVGHTIGMSSAIKFGLIAEGQADIYPRLGKTMEWDTAAGQAIVEAAGGHMEALDGKPFFYGKAGYLNPGFIVFGKKPV